ncbi:MAG TPA: hypothetical protein VK211_01630 [Kamptonema sp.]|nr:hypothetical protein [Kamptonema sp.]
MGTLFKLTTIAILGIGVQLSTLGTARAVAQVSNDTSNQGTLTYSDLSSFFNCANYEPDPNGNPKSDGTGTR